MKSAKSFLAITLLCISLTSPAHNIMKLNQGYLFSFEGIDGSGKTTVMNLVAEKLSSMHFSVITTREPGATELGKMLRSMLMNRTIPTCTTAEFLLFAADRAQHFHELVMPKLQENYIVLSDRMADSALVYQGYVKGLSYDMIKSVNNWAMQYRQPDIVIYLKVTAETAMARIKKRNQTAVPFEQDILQKKQDIIHGFDAIFKDRNNVAIIDCTKTEAIQAATISVDPATSADRIADLIVKELLLPYIHTAENYIKKHEANQ